MFGIAVLAAKKNWKQRNAREFSRALLSEESIYFYMYFSIYLEASCEKLMGILLKKRSLDESKMDVFIFAIILFNVCDARAA